ncbi:hypothetical protein RH831_10840 [Halodesulfurarchaeum sp. HSR-GB]|uniref:hypothetical protein n=1 Tax=Halodesulfurarchaeum sp. HSR-GB TaxID=3074077 RepID=UPI002857B8F3|nr:hypothetical protein [Halodesulfurarchaeum sp. HSR-GB]MDR5657672.1 hypothetical protein [Halodesulfurarchaeum sp. HSR-GB]
MTDSDNLMSLLSGLIDGQYEVQDIYARNNRLTIYSASSTGVGSNYDYPYKLEKYPGSETIRDTCVEYILDSNINDPSVTNQEILDMAFERRADYVVPKDTPGNAKETVASLREFRNLMDKHRDLYGHLTPIAPLQPPHKETYLKYESLYEKFPIIGIGGLRNANPSRQLAAVKNVREVVGQKPIHGFGMGGQLDFIKTVRDNPGLIQSVDLSTPEQAPMNGHQISATLNQVAGRAPHGEKSSQLRGLSAERNLLILNYLYSNLLDDHEIESTWKSVFQDRTLGEFRQSTLA